MPKAPSGPARAARATRSNQRTSSKNPTGRSSFSAKRPTAGPAPRRAEAGVTRFTRFRRSHPMWAALVPVALVVAVLAALVVIKTTSGPALATPAASTVTGGGAAATASADGTSALPAGVLSAVTSVSPATLAAIGSPSGVSSPVATGTRTPVIDGPDGKPEILYVGAEFCPFCAAQRWAVVVALSRFGTFSGLKATHSSTTDVYPDTKTFSFYGSTYASPSIDFVPVEEQTNQVVNGTYTTLQTPTAGEEALLAKYDTAPYTSQPGSIPFLDIANKYVLAGAQYNPQVLAGLSTAQIASQLSNPASPVAKAIDGSANVIITAINQVLHNTASRS